LKRPGSPHAYLPFLSDSRPPSTSDSDSDIKASKKDILRKGWEIDYSEISIQSRLGQGGFGIVYSGMWRQQQVAVKQINTILPGSEDLEAFEHEVEVMKNVKPHANVAVFLGMCREPLCIVMEYLPGGNVKSLLTSNQSLSLHMVLNMARDTAAGMFHLHEEKIIHRDLACRNLLLTETMKVKISDFGLSRFATQETNTTNTAIGPLRWMAPEALISKTYSTKSDMWSFGCVLIEMLTRDDPFPNLVPIQAVLEVTKGQKLILPEEIDCPKELRNLVESCFGDPSERPDFDVIGNALTQIAQDLLTQDQTPQPNY
jgi:serine/threonine protein kinase